MKSKMLIGAIACGAILGSAAAVAIVPSCTSMRSRRKLLKYKNHMFKTIGSVIDTATGFRR